MFGIRLFFLIDYLERYSQLYKIDHFHVDPYSSVVMYGSRGYRLNTIDWEWQSRYHYKRRTNIVISDMDTINTCDRPLVKLLRLYVL